MSIRVESVHVYRHTEGEAGGGLTKLQGNFRALGACLKL